LTLVELAKLSGISRKTLSYLERGLREPRPSNITRLATTLQCEARDLMEGEPIK
jgi:transcriptional regulator with XRE-family HTH domain